MSATHLFSLSADGEILTYVLSRSTRTSGPPTTFRLKRSGWKEAYTITLEDNWEIQGRLDVQAMLISLQGVVNKSGPRMYILYPQDWPFTYVNSVYEFYRDKRHYTFNTLKSPEEALRSLAKYAKGYVVWDKSVRTSMIIAFTVAGLENAVVLSEDQIPLAGRLGLKCIEDFRGRFTGQSDAQISHGRTTGTGRGAARSISSGSAGNTGT